MIDIDEIIDLVKPVPEPIMKLSDIQEEPNGCISCKICGNLSGTLRIISHFYNCTYKHLEPPTRDVIIRGERIISSPLIDRSYVENVLQREYSTVSSSTEKKIIASIGAASCVILCMRNRETTETMLAHIDDPTIDFIKPFLRIDPCFADIYLIGGSPCYKNIMYKILLELQKNHYYRFTFCHIMDDETNHFAIDCRTGETWLNGEVDDLPYTENERKEMEIFSNIGMYVQKELKRKI